MHTLKENAGASEHLKAFSYKRWTNLHRDVLGSMNRYFQHTFSYISNLVQSDKKFDD